MKASRMIRRLARDRRGAVAIEFAFVVWPLMLLMFGVIEVSRLVWVQNVIHEAAMSGARCMAIRSANCATADVYNAAKTTTFVRKAAKTWAIDIAAAEIALKPSAGCGKSAGFSEVVIHHTFSSVLLAFKGLDLTATACQPNQT